MPRLHPSAAALIAVIGLAGSLCSRTAVAEARLDDLLAEGAVNGKVTAPSAGMSALTAVSSARVYAYEVADLSLHRVLTDDRGEFAFASLPAGIYKIITHKAGFAPMVVLLSRASAAAKQYLELQLEREAARGDKQSFWTLRDQVPPDVLREIESDDRIAALTEDARSALDGRLRANVLAMRGMSDLPGSAAQRTTGSVGIETRLGEVSVGVNGRFSQIDPSGLAFQSGSSAIGAGQTQALNVHVAGGQDQFNVSTLSSRQNTADGLRVLPVEFERYGVSWARPVGGSGRSQVTAQYTNESNFYKRGWVTPLSVADFSQTLRVEGSYVDELSQNASLETGVRFHQRNGQFNYRNRAVINDTPDQSVDVFGRGTLRVMPTMLVEYGLYSTLRDGSVSLMPSGGVVLQLGSKWQAASTVAQRLHRGPETNPQAFMPVMFGENGASEPAESYLYRVELTRTNGEGNTFKVGALDRKFDRSLRMYFSTDVFDHLENLFLVPGDRVPEVQASISRRLTQNVVGKLESSYGTGGGGMVLGTQRRTYTNQVRYLVTSVNARYEPTSTGVFIAFRRVEQDLAPSGANWVDPEVSSIDSLDLQLTQDLGSLFSAVEGWALRLELGIDRGASPYILSASGDELRKRVLAGVAVQF